MIVPAGVYKNVEGRRHEEKETTNLDQNTTVDKRLYSQENLRCVVPQYWIVLFDKTG